MALASQIMGSTELIQVAEAVAREKGINRDQVIESIEQAISVAARKKYGYDQNIRAQIDKKSGVVRVFRERTVVETVDLAKQEETNKITEITLADAQRIKPGIQLGETLEEELPPMDVGRVAAQTAKQVITQNIKGVEKEKQYEAFKNKKDTIVHGSVKTVEYGNITIDVAGVDAVLRKEDVIPRENYRAGDRIRAYVVDVKRDNRGAQVILSRTHNNFMAKLFAAEVPEIYDGIIEVKAVARDPGSRAKIAVMSRDGNIDAKASCIGIRGARVQAVVSELQGEKIDIIEYSADPAQFVVAALTPATVSKVVVEEDEKRIEVVVPEEQQSLAIGRRGQNVKLASQLTGWYIEILTEAEESKRRQEEFEKLSKLFIEALDVEEIIAQLLVTEGFASIEEVAFVEIEELASIEGFDENVATELQTRAKDYLETREANLLAEAKKNGAADDLLELVINGEKISTELVVKLASKGIKTRDDLADLSYDEFKEQVPDSGLNGRQVNEYIMAAREHWFNKE
jgi:N utilization substance protein A